MIKASEGGGGRAAHARSKGRVAGTSFAPARSENKPSATIAFHEKLSPIRATSNPGARRQAATSSTGERDARQRRNQKYRGSAEPADRSARRGEMGEQAVALEKAVGYDTPARRIRRRARSSSFCSGDEYRRLQGEHREGLVTGIDLVEQ